MSSGVYVDVEVEVDEYELKKAGYHHQDNCQAQVLERALRVMHDAHHEGPFRLCRTEPCRELS